MAEHGKYRPLVGVLALVLGLCCAGPGMAAPCRLALLLALDVSSSVDTHEDRLQRQGLAAALIAPEVARAFLAPGGSVALAVYEWSGRNQFQTLLAWSLIRDRGDLVSAAQTLHESRRGHDDFPTAIGHALGHGAGLMARAPDCAARVIDVSGDGVNNEGFGPRQAYHAFPFDGIGVNGLVIFEPGGQGHEVLRYYRDELRTGPGAFVEVADGFEDFERAMRRKLTRELGGAMIGARASGAGPRG